MPHQSVYRYDPQSRSFSQVLRAEWDDSEGFVSRGCGTVYDADEFSIEDDLLFFHGEPMEVAGCTALNITDPASQIDINRPVRLPPPNVVAVLSTDGEHPFHFPAASGQHYHQLFSKEDGSPVGPALRLAMGGEDNSIIRGCWTIDYQYVIYKQGTDAIPIAGRICMVPVGELLSTTGEE